MKKLLFFISLLTSFAIGADVEPFVFENVASDHDSQQAEFDYMLKYKLFGKDYMTIGNGVVIPDKSGWNGTAGSLSANARLHLGGATIVGENINMNGTDGSFITGPIRANTITVSDRDTLNGYVCANSIDSKAVMLGTITDDCSVVPEAPLNLTMPVVDWDNLGQDTILSNIEILNNNLEATIYVPDGDGTYDILIDVIHLCKPTNSSGSFDGCKLYVNMPDGGRLTRIFVKDLVIGNHTTIQVVYRTEKGNEIQAQDKYRGNLMFYTDNDITFERTDDVPIQGTFITTKKIYLACNLDFAGQLLGNQLEIGDQMKGENFRFVPFDPPIIDIPELDKDGGLRENDSTVVIPISLDTAGSVDVFFSYCFDLKNGVDSSDFNYELTDFPVCGISTKTVVIPEGSLTPYEPITINVKVDTLTELNDYLVLKINIESGAILPNNKTDGELKIKIVDSNRSPLAFDTTAVYRFDENKLGFVDTIKTLNKTNTTRFVLNSSYTDRYTLDSITGVLTLVSNPLDYELSIIDTIKVTLLDTGNVSITRNIPISVNDVNEAPLLNDTTLYLSENLPIPSIIGYLKASDEDIRSEFRNNIYKIVAGDTNTFKVDKTTGRITASKIFNYESDDSVYTLKVKVMDETDTTLCDSATITIKISDTNEGPRFATDDTTLFVNENEPAGIIGSIPAIDEDGDSIKYEIVGNVPFTVDSVGNISSTRPFDYETETGIQFKLVASDGTITDTVKVNVKIKNVNEECNVNDITFSIDENKTGKIGNVNATDKDKDTLFGTISYSISDTANYKIDKDGNVFVKTEFNYEDKQFDTLKVYITDGTFKDTATIVIKVNNIPEDITLTANIDKVDENVEIGTPVGVIKGVDGDSTVVSYEIVNTNEFRIDPTTGVIMTNSNIDYETKNEYTVIVRATSTDSSSKDTTITIQVNNINEPLTVRDTTFTIPEDSTGILGKIDGVDEDGDDIKYNISDSSNYIIDDNGVLSIKEPFDYEKQQFDTLYVYATDGEFTDTAIVIINIENVNERPILQPNDSLNVEENCDTCAVGVITAIDPDIDDKIIYEVIEPGFTIDSTGTLKTTEPFDYETTKEIIITVVAKDTSGASDTLKYTVTIEDVNEPVHVQDTTCTIKENYTGDVCKIPAKDDDGLPPKYIVTDTTNYSIDSTGQLIIKNPIDFENKPVDTVTVIVTDGVFYDTAQVIVKIEDVPEHTEITEVDDKPKQDTIKTNDTDHKIEWQICEDNKCILDSIDVKVHKDTTIRVCNVKKTSCDEVVILFNDAPPVVTLTNAKSTDTWIDYITIEEQKDDKIYVNKKENPITVTVKDTVRNTTKTFDITVKLDTLASKDIKLKEYNYVIDEMKATITPIGDNKAEMVEIIDDNGTKITIKKIVDLNTKEPIDSIQTVSYTKTINGKDVVISYKTDNMTGTKLTDYTVSYMIDSCTSVSYTMNDKKQIVKNEEGNIGYTISYDYIDDFGNKATASVDIVYDDIPPKVEILSPVKGETFNTNAVAVKWTVNGEVQDTLTLQRLEKGSNFIIRRYVDKAGNEACDTVRIIMKEAKDIDVSIIHPVTEINQDKVDQYYANGNEYNPKKPFTIKIADPKSDSIPEPIGVGFKIDIALPSVSATGGLASLNDLVKNGQIPVDDKGNIVGASTKGIPVDKYVEEHCTAEFQEDYHTKGFNIPLYDVKYQLHLWVWTTTAGYVNDFIVEYTLNDEDEASEAGTVQMVIDWLADKNGAVNASNGKQLGTSSYITKLYSKSIAKHRCDYKEQVKGEKTVKKTETTKIFGYKRPKK